MPYKDPVVRKAYMKQHHIEHREEKSTYDKQYYKENREKRSIQKKQYYKDTRKERLAKQSQYQKDHPEVIEKYRKDHPEVFLKSKKKQLTRLGQMFDKDCHNMRYAIDAWSKTVRKRDKNKCTWCNSTKNLVAHHIWHKVFCPESTLDVDNGITLCRDCLMEQHRLDRL